MTSELFAAMTTLADELLARKIGTLTHRENCLCPKACRERPPVMLDERSVAPGLLNGAILETLAEDRLTSYPRTWPGEAGGRCRDCEDATRARW